MRMLAGALLAFSTVGAAVAQTTPQPAPATPGVAAGAPTKTHPAVDPALATEPYSYEPGGRRDPFLNLMGTGSEARGSGRRGEGSAALTVAEVSVRGVIEGRGGIVAMLLGPDKKTLVVHPGDRLADGTIKAITPQGLVIMQDVNDPLSLVKQREVRKLLKSLEDAKQ